MLSTFQVSEVHNFRHAAEVSKETHGGYLIGKIPIPAEVVNWHPYEIQLDLIPSSKSGQTIHPNLLHVTDIDDKGKCVYKTQLSEESWRVTLVNNRDSCSIKEKHEIPLKSCYVDESSLNLGGSNGLKLTIITPLQREGAGRSLRPGVSIMEVLRNKAGNNNISLSEIAKSFVNKKTNPDAKLELHRVRLRATFIKNGTIRKTLVSNDITNSKNKDLGKIGIESIFPSGGCTKGAKIYLISKWPVPSTGIPIFPKFSYQIEKGIKVDASRVIQTLAQISVDTVEVFHKGIFVFNVPPQDKSVFSRNGKDLEKLQISLYRKREEEYSADGFDFRYFEHDEDEDCPSCFFSGSMTRLNREIVIGRKRRRTTESAGSPDSGTFSLANENRTMSDMEEVEELKLVNELINNSELLSDENYDDVRGIDINFEDVMSPISGAQVSIQESDISHDGIRQRCCYPSLDIETEIVPESWSPDKAEKLLKMEAKKVLWGDKLEEIRRRRHLIPEGQSRSPETKELLKLRTKEVSWTGDFLAKCWKFFIMFIIVAIIYINYFL